MAKINTVFKETTVAKAENPNVRTRNIHIDSLVESKFQYRDLQASDVQDLAEIISADGKVLQPLLVRKAGADTYEILAGHKRYRACKYLVEEEGLEEFGLLPCCVENMDDVQAEFATYSTNNAYGEKSPYDLMCEIEGMKRLIKENPETFGKESGRLVERLGKQLGLATSTVKEYETIRNNLGKKAMAAFKNGEIGKSAALALSSRTEIEQNAALRSGKKTYTEIKEYFTPKENVPESGTNEEDVLPGQVEIADFAGIVPELNIRKVTEEEKEKLFAPIAKNLYETLSKKNILPSLEEESLYYTLIRSLAKENISCLHVFFSHLSKYSFSADVRLLPTHILMEAPTWVQPPIDRNYSPEGFADVCREVWKRCEAEEVEEQEKAVAAAAKAAARPDPTAEDIKKLFQKQDIRNGWSKDKAENIKTLKRSLRWSHSDLGQGQEKGYAFRNKKEVSWTQLANLITEHIPQTILDGVIRKNEERRLKEQERSAQIERIRELEKTANECRRAFCDDMLRKKASLPTRGEEKKMLDVLFRVGEVCDLLAYPAGSAWGNNDKTKSEIHQSVNALTVEGQLLYVLLAAAHELDLTSYDRKIKTENAEYLATIYEILDAYGYSKTEEEQELLTLSTEQ